jgi:RimJ/RimL family protein N-acetyltransferase
MHAGGGVILRRATAEDIAAFSDMENKPTVIAWVGEVHEEGREPRVIGLGGFGRVGHRWHAFCDLTPEARRHKKTIVRAARLAMAEARRMGMRYVYTDRDPHEPGSARWLQSLGFELDPRSLTYYRWSPE